MTDQQIAEAIATIFNSDNGRWLFASCVTTVNSNGMVSLIAPAEATQYYLRKCNACIVELPLTLSDNNSVAIAQIALAVGRRLERFERGKRVNASRTPEQKSASARKAIQTRWSKQD